MTAYFRPATSDRDAENAVRSGRSPAFTSQRSRRQALQIGGHGFLGLSLASFLSGLSQPSANSLQAATARPRRTKSVIFLYQFGGPSHLETFDYKPDAPAEIRGQHHAIQTSLPGYVIGEHLPRMATLMDRLTVIHSLHHGMLNHNPASYYMLSGHEPPRDDIRLPPANDLFPAYGSVLDALRPAPAGIPTFVGLPTVIRDGSITPGQTSHFLGSVHDPLTLTGDPNSPQFQPPQLSLPEELSLQRMGSRREMLRWLDSQSRLLDQSAEARQLDAHYDKAVTLINSQTVKQAFDLSQEPDTLRDRYGRTTYGQSCLLARRLVEAGVPFVNVYFSASIGGRSKTSGGWDTHGFDGSRMYPILEAWQLPLTNQAVPTLFEDLQERGLLDETLVIWMGEFGRTPQLNASASRDHWPRCFSVLLGGGGVPQGLRYGRSDAHGAYPAVDPVRPDDLSATLFTLLGLEPQTLIHDRVNRPAPIAAGNPISALIG